MNLLTNKQVDIQGNWYAPKKFLEQHKSVLQVELVDTTSSAGDWNGVFAQRELNRCYLIPFSQTNNFPKEGFHLSTGEVVVSWTYDPTWLKEDVTDGITIIYGLP
jgi:hypothetical protein